MRAPQTSILPTTAVALALLLGAGVAAAGLAFSAGAVRIKVVEQKPDGARVNLLLPAALVPLGVRFLPESNRRELAARLGPFLPALREACLELARSEDFTLVEARDHGEHVRIRVVSGSLLVDVDSPDEVVHLSFPLKLAARLAADLEPLAPQRVALLQDH